MKATCQIWATGARPAHQTESGPSSGPSRVDRSTKGHGAWAGWGGTERGRAGGARSVGGLGGARLAVVAAVWKKGRGRDVEGTWKGCGRDVEGTWKGRGRDVEGMWKGRGRDVAVTTPSSRTPRRMNGYTDDSKPPPPATPDGTRARAHGAGG
eukprot:1721366-Prymnesium_polylepis.1